MGVTHLTRRADVSSQAVDAVPALLLHVAIFLFFASPVDFPSSIDNTVGRVIFEVICVFGDIYALLIVLPNFQPNFPSSVDDDDDIETHLEQPKPLGSSSPNSSKRSPPRRRTLIYLDTARFLTGLCITCSHRVVAPRMRVVVYAMVE